MRTKRGVAPQVGSLGDYFVEGLYGTFAFADPQEQLLAVFMIQSQEWRYYRPLVKALEEKGIGRPSTYAAIMSTIQEREYVERLEGRFHPTTLGKTVNDLLIEGGFDDLFNVTYTARMEEELDHVEEGRLKWTEALREFYGKFEEDLGKFKQHVHGIKNVDIPTDEVCLKCETAGMVRAETRVSVAPAA